jgi:hypothetical protein
VPKSSVMTAAASQQLSPELVLVSPDLRATALESLPAIDPDALFVVEPRPAPAPPAPEPLFLGAIRGALLFLVIAVAVFLLTR